MTRVRPDIIVRRGRKYCGHCRKRITPDNSHAQCKVEPGGGPGSLPNGQVPVRVAMYKRGSMLNASVTRYLCRDFVEVKTAEGDVKTRYLQELPDIDFADVARLPEHFREVFMAVECEGERYHAIAQRLSLAESTVRGRMKAARDLLNEFSASARQEMAV